MTSQPSCCRWQDLVFSALHLRNRLNEKWAYRTVQYCRQPPSLFDRKKCSWSLRAIGCEKTFFVCLGRARNRVSTPVTPKLFLLGIFFSAAPSVLRIGLFLPGVAAYSLLLLFNIVLFLNKDDSSSMVFKLGHSQTDPINNGTLTIHRVLYSSSWRIRPHGGCINKTTTNRALLYHCTIKRRRFIFLSFWRSAINIFWYVHLDWVSNTICWIYPFINLRTSVIWKGAYIFAAHWCARIFFFTELVVLLYFVHCRGVVERVYVWVGRETTGWTGFVSLSLVVSASIVLALKSSPLAIRVAVAAGCFPLLHQNFWPLGRFHLPCLTHDILLRTAANKVKNNDDIATKTFLNGQSGEFGPFSRYETTRFQLKQTQRQKVKKKVLVVIITILSYK